MKKKKIIALLLILTFCLSARAESSLSALVDAAERLAFSTDNVTITGKADFYLNDQRFKTAEITYVQDGENAFWQEKLRTPRSWREDLESGFTIVQNGFDYYLMEALNPGVYAYGTTGEETTLLRKTARAEFLFDLARTAAGEVLPLLGADIIVGEKETGETTVQLNLKEGNIPALLSHLAYLSMEFIGQRLTGENDDAWKTSDVWFAPFTPTMEILNDTHDFRLGDCSVRLELDNQGRLTAVAGSISAWLKDYTENSRQLRIVFEAALSDYGTSRVAQFDPKDYDVTNASDLSEQGAGRPRRAPAPLTQPDWVEEKVRQALKEAGFADAETAPVTESNLSDGYCHLTMETENGVLRASVNENGTIEEIYNTDTDFIAGDGELTLDAAMEQRITDFLAVVYPGFTVTGISVTDVSEDGNRALVYAEGNDRFEESCATLLIRLSPDWLIESYTSGNG